MLKIYPIVLELIRRMSPGIMQIKDQSPNFGEQFERTLMSLVLNVVEGTHLRGQQRQERYQAACGSARAALACWETAEAFGWVQSLDPELAALFQRIIATLVRLGQSNST